APQGLVPFGVSGSANLLVRSGPRQQRELMKILGLALVSFLLAWNLTGCKPAVPAHGLELILTAKGVDGTALKADEFQRVASVLAQRVDALGFPSSYLRVES